LHPRDAYEIGIGAQHDQVMPDTKLGEEGIYRRDLHAPLDQRSRGACSMYSSSKQSVVKELVNISAAIKGTMNEDFLADDLIDDPVRLRMDLQEIVDTNSFKFGRHVTSMRQVHQAPARFFNPL